MKEAMERENSGRRREEEEEEEWREEGMEEERGTEPDSGRSSPAPSPQKERKPSGLINFSAARARQKTVQAARAATSRGSELLGMIRLDIVTLDLLDLPPIRYEAFMKTFGKTNNLQAASQTGEVGGVVFCLPFQCP